MLPDVVVCPFRYGMLSLLVGWRFTQDWRIVDGGATRDVSTSCMRQLLINASLHKSPGSSSSPSPLLAQYAPHGPSPRPPRLRLGGPCTRARQQHLRAAPVRLHAFRGRSRGVRGALRGAQAHPPHPRGDRLRRVRDSDVESLLSRHQFWHCALPGLRPVRTPSYPFINVSRACD